MKKRVFLLCFFVLFVLFGCNKGKKTDYKEQLIEYNSKLTQYVSESEMKIKKEEGDVSFDIEVSYLSPNFYKVVMKNNANNNIQVIIKNEEGVYVITPAMNKQFKFNSDWPLNSSHAYLYQSIVKDITNDPESTVTVEGKSFTVVSTIEQRTNANLKVQKATFDCKTKAPKTNSLCNANNEALVTVTFNSFKTDCNLKSTDFDPETVNNTIKLELAEGEVSGNLEECVPTFMPEGYKEGYSVKGNNQTVVSYTCDDNTYIITCVLTETGESLVVSRQFDSIVDLTHGFGFVNANSLSFYNDNLLVTIYNSDFNLEEAIQIANSFA